MVFGRCLVAVLGWLGAATFAEEPLRVWTDVEGRGVRARYVSHDEEHVSLELEDGREAKVPLERLSEVTRLELEERVKAAAGARPAGHWEGSLDEDVALPEKPTIEELRDGLGSPGEFAYASDHYRFVSTVPLSTQLMRDLAELFEATYLMCHRVPLGFERKAGDERLDVRLFETVEQYVAAGGGAGSPGMFLRNPDRVVVPLENLGVRRVGSRYMVDREKSSVVLIQILIHQLMPKGYTHRGSNADWVQQGIALYLGAAPYKGGRFRVGKSGEELREMAVGYGSEGLWGWGLGETLYFPPLERLFSMPYHQVVSRDVIPNEVAAAMVLAYFAEMDGEKDGRRLKAFLQRLKTAPWGMRSQRLCEPLRDGRSLTELQEEVSRGWKRHGVEIRWQER